MAQTPRDAKAGRTASPLVHLRVRRATSALAPEPVEYYVLDVENASPRNVTVKCLWIASEPPARPHAAFPVCIGPNAHWETRVPVTDVPSDTKNVERLGRASLLHDDRVVKSVPTGTDGNREGLKGLWDRLLAQFEKLEEPAWSQDALEDPAVAEALTTHVLDRPDGIRQRALNAATIAGGAAAVLGAFGGFGGISQRPVLIQGSFAIALCLWLASVFLYIGAIAWSPGPRTSLEIPEMLNNFRDYAQKLRARVRLGSYIALLAVGFTMLSVVALAIESIGEYGEQDVVVSLAAATAAAISTSCGWEADSDQLRAKVRVRDLGKAVVPLQLGDNRQNVAHDSEDKSKDKSEDKCKGRKFRVPRRSVLATRSAG